MNYIKILNVYKKIPLEQIKDKRFILEKTLCNACQKNGYGFNI